MCVCVFLVVLYSECNKVFSLEFIIRIRFLVIEIWEVHIYNGRDKQQDSKASTSDLIMSS